MGSIESEPGAGPCCLRILVANNSKKRSADHEMGFHEMLNSNLGTIHDFHAHIARTTTSISLINHTMTSIIRTPSQILQAAWKRIAPLELADTTWDNVRSRSPPLIDQ
jgi:hypothetical protein